MVNKMDASTIDKLYSALKETQSLLVAILHETRPTSEIEAQIVENRKALIEADRARGR